MALNLLNGRARPVRGLLRMVGPSTRDAVNPPRPSHLLLVLLGLSAFGSNAASIKLQCTPNQPKSGEPVSITARFKTPFPDGVALQYQLVDPGRYIALADPAFQSNWVSWPMRDDGMDGDARRGDGVFMASLPGRLQENLQLFLDALLTDELAETGRPKPQFNKLLFFLQHGFDQSRHLGLAQGKFDNLFDRLDILRTRRIEAFVNFGGRQAEGLQRLPHLQQDRSAAGD